MPYAWPEPSASDLARARDQRPRQQGRAALLSSSYLSATCLREEPSGPAGQPPVTVPERRRGIRSHQAIPAATTNCWLRPAIPR